MQALSELMKRRHLQNTKIEHEIKESEISGARRGACIVLHQNLGMHLK